MKLLTVAEVAQFLGVSPAWVRDHASGRHRPFLPSRKMGKHVRFRHEDIETFLEDCRRVAPKRGKAA